MVRPAQRGGIALIALLTLAALVGVVTYVLVVAEGQVQRWRRMGGEAQARRAAYAVISRQLVAERIQQPRAWIPPLVGEGRTEEGIQVRWRREPVEGRWRVGHRIWQEAELERWRRLGADPAACDRWAGWLEARAAQRDPAMGARELVTDRVFLASCFQDLGLARPGRSVDRVWTVDEAGAVGRLNLLGAEASVLADLSGLPAARVLEVQGRLEGGVSDPSELAGLWSFVEGQAVEPWASIRPFPVALWTAEVHLPTLKEPIWVRLRSSGEDGTPGNPWFQLRPWSMEQW